jgi:hypothetical protein
MPKVVIAEADDNVVQISLPPRTKYPSDIISDIIEKWCREIDNDPWGKGASNG